MDAPSALVVKVSAVWTIVSSCSTRDVYINEGNKTFVFKRKSVALLTQSNPANLNRDKLVTEVRCYCVAVV